MRRWIVVLTVVAIIAIAGAIVWATCGNRLQAWYVLNRAAAAWRNTSDYRADFDLDMDLGVLSSLPLSGTVRVKRPDRYRLDLGNGLMEWQLIGRDDRVWVYLPALALATEVEFSGAADSFAPSKLMDRWEHEVDAQTNARFAGSETVDGRKTWVLVVPMTRPREGEAAPSPDRWQQTRINVDCRSRLPIRVAAVKGNGAPLFTWTARNPQANPGLPEEDFALPAEATVIRREYDPEHPEKLFLPPAKPPEGKKKRGDFLQGLLDHATREQEPRSAR